jgi:hypothetical protein
MFQKSLFMMMPLPIFSCTGGVGILVVLSMLLAFAILFLYLFVRSIIKYRKTKNKITLLGILPLFGVVLYYLTVVFR